MNTKKNFVCIFAHPDDEAFGPSGTIAKLTKEYNVYILCATKGQAGQDAETNAAKKLAERRAEELRNSAKVLGVKKIYFLGFKDGTLSNNIYHKISEKIQHHLEILKPEKIMTVEPKGVSGHLDHIAISFITSFVFYKKDFIKELWQHGILKQRAEMRRDYFVYFPPGYEEREFDKVVDVEDVWTTKLAAINQHKSQAEDIKAVTKQLQSLPKKEYFFVIKK